MAAMLLTLLVGCRSEAFGATPESSIAADYPQRPIRIVVPGPPAGTTDIMARLFAQRFSQAFSQNAVVDNRPGASGFIAAETVARSAPDGYTLMVVYAGVLAINPALFDKLPYDPQKDFAPVGNIAIVTNVLVVSPSSAAQSVADLVRRGQSQPGTLNFGSAGVGTSTHLSGELFRTLAKIDVVHVPFKGQAPALIDLFANRVDYMFIGIPTALGHIKAGKLRALGVTSSARSSALPDIPTVSEAGVPGFEASTWFGIVAPAKTPASVVDKLNWEIKRMLASAGTQKLLLSYGAEPSDMSPAQFSAFIASEIKKWAQVVRSSGAKAH